MKTLALGLLLAASVASADFFDTTDTQLFNEQGGYWTVQGDHHEPIAFLPGPAAFVLTRCCGFGFGERHDASPATLEAGIEALFPHVDIELVSNGYGDGRTSSSVDIAGDVYAIKYGDDMLIWGFNERQESMAFGLLPHGYSNYRVWNRAEGTGTFTAVDAPWTPALIALGLVGLLAARKQH